MGSVILRVKSADFLDAARRYAGADEAFIAETPGGVTLTAVNVRDDMMVLSQLAATVAEARAFLAGGGFQAKEGHWSSDEDEPGDPMADLHLIAVAYRSRESMPGLWVDAYPYAPTPAEVIQALYDEFVAGGELADVGIEEFMRLAHPNVVILGPDKIRDFAMKKARDNPAD
jgi:hypothetical protein